MHQSEKINCIANDGITNVERKRSGAATGKTVGADMVAALPLDNFPGLSGNSFLESAGQALGNDLIALCLGIQISLEEDAENCIHDGRPKTS